MAKKKVIISDIEKEKLVKTIKNPNVSKAKKNRAKDRLIVSENWSDEYEQYIHMNPTELYAIQGK